MPISKLFDTTLLSSKAALALESTVLPKPGLQLDNALAREKAVGVVNGLTPPAAVTPPPPVPSDIAKDSALGRVRETAAVAKRLEVAPGVEFVNIARQTKERFFVDGLKLLRQAGYALEEIPVTGFVVEDVSAAPPPPVASAAAPPGPVPTAPPPPRRPMEDAAELLRRFVDAPDAKVFDEDDDPQLDLKDQNEGRFFALGLNSVDSTVRFLRNLEARTDDYRRLQANAMGARDRLRAARVNIAAEIGALDTQLAEVRHDLAVARSLRAEEEQRVARVVARRRAILAEQVPYLVFRRPLFTRSLDNAPVMPAEPALVADPVPAARAQTDELLPELQQMVDTLRDVPARWFLKAWPLFERFDRALSIERLVSTAFDRVEALAQAGGRPIRFVADGNKTAQQLRSTFDDHTDRILRIAQDSRGLLATALGGSAKTALDTVRRFASMSDLLRAAPPTRDTSLSAAGLLDDVGNVAQSLYERFCDVPPATRLRWAELFSELDRSVPLRQLTVLPDFGNEATGVDFIQWRQLQKLVDWLFLQVDADPDAVAAINDLVRVCLLLSAHAPVKRILSARIRRPVPTVIDTRMELELDPQVARIGMQVLVHAPQTDVVIARAVVEDISATGGLARITQVLAAQQTIDGNHRVQLQSGPPLSTNAAAQADRANADAQRASAQVQMAVRQEAQSNRQLRGTMSPLTGRR